MEKIITVEQRVGRQHTSVLLNTINTVWYELEHNGQLTTMEIECFFAEELCNPSLRDIHTIIHELSIEKN